MHTDTNTIHILTHTYIHVLDECITLWGKPDRVHMQNMELGQARASPTLV